MISRRHIRIKVMQSVYALQTQHSDDLVKEEKFIRSSIDKMYQLYALELQLLVELKKLAKKLYEVSVENRKVIGQADMPNAKFVQNSAIEILESSTSLATYIEENQLNYWQDHDEYVRIIYDLMTESSDYAAYLNSETSSYAEDHKFVQKLFSEIIAPNDKLDEFYEDSFIGWVDDLPFVNTWVLKTLRDLNPKHVYVLPALYKNEEDEAFGVELFRKVVLNQEKYQEEIVKKTPNWDIDRIAEMDLILIAMGIAEFLEFPSIPVRVSMNEYIEIAKDYSTEKSGYFINGVLDKIQKDFAGSKRLNKIGRGLQ